MDNFEALLAARNINPTALRLLIYKTMTEYVQAFSLSDLEQTLDTVDKSTIYRTISLFHQNLLIHSIDDGSGSIKYSVCNNDCECSVNELHTHFYCQQCAKTFCLKDTPIPKMELPKGFEVRSINLVLKGLCVNCPKAEIKSVSQ